MVDACSEAASDAECDVETLVEQLFRGYRLPRTAPPVAAAAAALESLGIEPAYVATGRRQRRQRADRRRPARAERGQRHRGQPPARRVGHHRGAGENAGPDAGDRGRRSGWRLSMASSASLPRRSGRATSAACAWTPSATTTARRPTREIVTHPGAVTVVPFDGERIWLVRQPREPVGEQALLELPAGKIDREGEELEDARQARARRGDRQGRARVAPPRELLQLAGPARRRRTTCSSRRTSTTRASRPRRRSGSRSCPFPLDRLDETISELKDAKTLIGLLWFRAFLRCA